MVLSRVAAASRIQQGRDLGGMVRVIVDHRDLLDGATHLETTRGAKEPGDGLGGFVRIDPSSMAAVSAAAALRALWTPGTDSSTGISRG